LGESLNDAEIEACGRVPADLGKVSTLGLVKARLAEAPKGEGRFLIPSTIGEDGD
jgi:hypothetical protein